MEKLIELLNKYYFEIGRKVIINRYDNYDNTHYGTFRGIEIEKSDYPYAILWGIELISKKFRFIQRLVKHDKIDLWNKEYECYWNEMYKNTNTTDAIIMELSIQDNPIEFLISILK